MTEYYIISKLLLIYVICLLFSCFVLTLSESNNPIKHRIKRKIIFAKSSKFFFRLNGKNNVLNYTDILVHGYAIRVNYDLPDTLPKRRKFFKRDVENELENIADSSDLNLYSCAIKKFCDVLPSLNEPKSCGMFCQIGNIISSSYGHEATFFKSVLDRCDYYTNYCMKSGSIDPDYNEVLS